MVLVTTLFPPLAQAASSQSWLPDRRTIDEIEAKIEMPAGARPVADYRRFYTGDRKDGRPVVLGTFVLRDLLQRPAAPINIVEKPDMPIILGDARLTLAEAPDGAYDLIIVDAFSSDAIPIHLLTREAMALYLKKLTPRGMVVMHVLNRHLELASVVAGIAAANGRVTLVSDEAELDEAANPYKFVGTVAAVARDEQDFGALAHSRDWMLEPPDPNQWVWTDDYCNIVGAVIRKFNE